MILLISAYSNYLIYGLIALVIILLVLLFRLIYTIRNNKYSSSQSAALSKNIEEDEMYLDQIFRLEGGLYERIETLIEKKCRIILREEIEKPKNQELNSNKTFNETPYNRFPSHSEDTSLVEKKSGMYEHYTIEPDQKSVPVQNDNLDIQSRIRKYVQYNYDSLDGDVKEVEESKMYLEWNELERNYKLKHPENLFVRNPQDLKEIELSYIIQNPTQDNGLDMIIKSYPVYSFNPASKVGNLKEKGKIRYQ